MFNTKTKSSVALVIEIFAVIGLLLHASLVLGAWNLLPAVIPVHFNFVGDADTWGDASDLFRLFGLSVLIYLGLTWLGRYAHKFNYPWQITADNAEEQYTLARVFLKAIKCETVWLFNAISWQAIGISLDPANGLGSFFVVTIVAITGLTAVGYITLASRTAFSDAH